MKNIKNIVLFFAFICVCNYVQAVSVVLANKTNEILFYKIEGTEVEGELAPEDVYEIPAMLLEENPAINVFIKQNKGYYRKISDHVWGKEPDISIEPQSMAVSLIPYQAYVKKFVVLRCVEKEYCVNSGVLTEYNYDFGEKCVEKAIKKELIADTRIYFEDNTSSDYSNKIQSLLGGLDHAKLFPSLRRYRVEDGFKDIDEFIEDYQRFISYLDKLKKTFRKIATTTPNFLEAVIKNLNSEIAWAVEGQNYLINKKELHTKIKQDRQRLDVSNKDLEKYLIDIKEGIKLYQMKQPRNDSDEKGIREKFEIAKKLNEVAQKSNKISNDIKVLEIQISDVLKRINQEINNKELFCFKRINEFLAESLDNFFNDLLTSKVRGFVKTATEMKQLREDPFYIKYRQLIEK